MFEPIKVDIDGQCDLNTSELLFTNLVKGLEKMIPVGRELSLVKTKLEEASFFANRGIALANEVK